ncbi:STY4526/YPO1902 family pathogenicity island replication protein [Uliginosibacterium gangwonense]|uniref:STY4526/YPO1902 family pathogenicity island replication protein n=1 Tax=Uliginosibacterium gangwonense TaxID=392736 RepID=UPI00035C1C92|nr:STY4526/YPO1902 family pathogenicity island replication protein [Uliginosibacterium gangwonense]
MVVKDEFLQRIFLSHVFRLLEEGRLPELLEAGFSMETLEALRGLSAQNLELLSTMNLRCSIKVEDATFMLSIQTVGELQKDKERLEYYVTHQAPACLLMTLFHVSGSELQKLKDSLCPPNKGGRYAMPGEKQREAIHAAWAAIGADTAVNPKDQWIVLHQKYEREFSIGTLWNVVNEFASPSASADNRR